MVAPVACLCGATKRLGRKDGLCQACRLRSLHAVLYPFAAAHDELLSQLYRGAKSRVDVSRGLTALAARFNFPRTAVANRASRLGLRFCTRIPWQPGEIDRLRNLAGEMPLRRIAYRMGRSEASVRQKLFQLGITNEQLTSYSGRQLAELMGVTHHAVSRWVAQGFLVLEDGRVPEWSVARFVWKHMDQYRFARADEFFLKSMLQQHAPKVFPAPAGRPKMREAA